jgi:predicted kinase
MARGVPGYVPSPGDELDSLTLTAFFDTLRTLLEHRVTVVAEAAFQDQVWTPNIARLAAVSDLRVIHCHADAAVAKRRIAERAGTRTAHADMALVASLDWNNAYFDDFRRFSSDAPTLDVDTTNGYTPALAEIVAFVG